MATGFRFIDLPTAAERLGTTRNQLLQWVDEGRIRPFSGKGQQSVYRSADVERLAHELAGPAPGVVEEQKLPEAPAGEASAVRPGEARRARRRDPVKLMGTHISMDSRWAEMSDQDIATWLDALELVQFERVRKVANIAIERLQKVLSIMDEFERK